MTLALPFRVVDRARAVRLTLSISGNQAKVAYSGLPTNRPMTYGNQIAVWQDTQVPYDGGPPLQAKPPSADTPDGVVRFDGLQLDAYPYIFAYCTSPETSSACATAVSYPGRNDHEYFSSEVRVETLTPGGPLVWFSSPAGNYAPEHGDWLGIWRGGSATFTGKHRLQRKPVTVEANSGTEWVEHDLGFGLEYTLAFAVGPRDADLAALVTLGTPALREVEQFLAFVVAAAAAELEDE